MADPVYNVLFICSANSARSIMAEAIVTRAGKGRFKGYSAGSNPAGKVGEHTLTLLKTLGYDTDSFRSKSWDEFAAAGAPQMDFIFTVCDDAAGESCPVWPGHPASAHWGIPDPAKVAGSHAEVSAAYDEAYRMLSNRIGAFINLPIAKLDHAALHQHLADIGRT
ncbi:MAG TPA: arsenate reductase ArsC [Bauldia sp.]|nr:arsenate reductase ArsC [Bauldia sp.]